MRLSLSNAGGKGIAPFSVEEVAGRTLMLLWFGLAIYLQASRTDVYLMNAGVHPLNVLGLTKSALGLTFSLIAIAMTITRRESKITATGLEPRIVAILGTYLMVAIPLLPSGHPPNAVKLLGDVLVAVGIFASLYCLVWLGRSFSIMASARNLVTAGPYRIIRHPVYACESLTLLGIVVAAFSPAAMAIGLTTVCLLWRRAINEERVLRQAFPEYDEYASRVPRIVPRALTGGALRPAKAGAVFGG